MIINETAVTPTSVGGGIFSSLNYWLPTIAFSLLYLPLCKLLKSLEVFSPDCGRSS
jgi:hypothetical protein